MNRRRCDLSQYYYNFPCEQLILEWDQVEYMKIAVGRRGITIFLLHIFSFRRGIFQSNSSHIINTSIRYFLVAVKIAHRNESKLVYEQHFFIQLSM